MAKLFYPQISLEDYQIFRKFMLPGEFPETHDQWVASIERSKREDAVKCLTYEGACDVEVEPDAFKKYCSDTGSKPTRHTLHEFISKLGHRDRSSSSSPDRSATRIGRTGRT